jgi:Skp family chaperone for outer membrane proteins
MKAILGASALVCLLMMTACGKPTGFAGGVAVIDIDKVAGAMGWLDEISKSIQAADTELRTQLSDALRNSLRIVEEAKMQVAAAARLTSEQTKLLTNAKDDRELALLPLTKEQRGQLTEAVNKANLVWRTAHNNYQQTLQNRRASLIQSYREKIRPTARRVAAARGMNVVLISSDNLLCFDSQSSDITDEVINELQKAFPVREQRATPPNRLPVSSRINAPASK